MKTKRIIRCVQVDGLTKDFEVKKFVHIRSENAPVFSLEKMRDGNYRFTINDHFDVGLHDRIEFIREDE